MEILTSVDLHIGLQRIESDTFRHCSALEKVEIPSTVTNFGWHVFYECGNLQSIDIKGGNNLPLVLRQFLKGERVLVIPFLGANMVVRRWHQLPPLRVELSALQLNLVFSLFCVCTTDLCCYPLQCNTRGTRKRRSESVGLQNILPCLLASLSAVLTLDS